MKRIIRLFVVILFVFVLVSCSCVNEKDEKLNITTSIFPIYSMTKIIVGETANVELVLKGGQDCHDFNPSSNTIYDIIDSDLFIYAHEEMEVWINKIMSVNKTCKIVKAGANVTLSEIEDRAEEEHDHDHEHDPHIWTSLINCISMAEVIYEAVSEADSENSETYLSNKIYLVNQLNSLIANFNSLFYHSSNKPTLYFVYPFQFHYFTEEFNLDYVSLYSTCSEEVQPTLNDLIEFIDLIKANNVKYLIMSEFQGASLLNKIKSEVEDVKFIIMDAGEKISVDNYNNGYSIIDLFNQIYQTMVLLESEA